MDEIVTDAAVEAACVAYNTHHIADRGTTQRENMRAAILAALAKMRVSMDDNDALVLKCAACLEHLLDNLPGCDEEFIEGVARYVLKIARPTIERETIERCAKVCESMHREPMEYEGYNIGPNDCADAIRSLTPASKGTP